MKDDTTAVFNVQDILTTFRDDIHRAGMMPPDHITPGELFRCRIDGKRSGLDGWALLHVNEKISVGIIGNWISGNQEKIVYGKRGEHDRHNNMTPDERAAFQEFIEKAKAKADAEKQAGHTRAAAAARRVCKKAVPANSEQRYLKEKGILAHDALTMNNILIIPRYNAADELVSFQRIFPDGTKKNQYEGETKGTFHLLSSGPCNDIYIVEGFATAATVREATRQAVAVAFTANNLDAVTGIMKKRYPDKNIIIAGDNDIDTEKRTGKNPGRDAAEAAAAAHDVKVCFPSVNSDFNDLYHQKPSHKEGQPYFNVLAELKNAVSGGPWDKPADIAGMIHKVPDPIPWLFNQRLPAGRGALLTGLGGSSKTTVLRTMAFGVVLREMPWSWEVDRTGKAVLVLTEDTAADVHRFIHYAARDLEEHQKRSIAENLFIYPLAGQDTILMHKTSTGTVERSPLFDALQRKIQKLGNVVFVGLDPALSITEGEELDQGHQRALGKMADDLAVNTGAAVLLVSHSTKGSLLTEELQSHSSRGGGAITDAVRAEFVLRNMTAKEAAKAGISDVEERHRHVQLVGTKGNQLPPSSRVPVWLRRDDFGNLSEVDIILDEKNTVTDSDIAIIKTHIEMSKHATVKLADWRSECVNRGLVSGETENAQNKAMYRTIKKLKALGLLADGIGKGIYVVTILGKATQR